MNKTRVREPRPYLSRRITSGRGATEQPNATGDNGATLTPMFWLLLTATGVAAGLFGDLMMLILHVIEHRAYGFHTGNFESGVARAAASRRITVLAIGGAVTGIGWYAVRRIFKNGSSDLDDALWAKDSQLSVRRSFASSVLSEIAVGVGASLGREAAPKLMGGAAGSLLARWGRLSPQQRRLLVACGGGAGMAAVYNVPLGGALITAEVLYGSLTLPVVLPALACSAIATAVAWIYLPNATTYLDIPSYRATGSLVVFSVVAGLVIGFAAVGYVRLIAAASALGPRGWPTAVLPAIAFAGVGVVAIHYPQLLGNGKDLAGPIFVGVGGAGLLIALAALKPVVTMICLGSGATGGLFTPTLATGAALGGFLGLGWIELWHGSPVGAFAIVGATAMLSAGLQAPLAGVALMLELTGTTDSIAVPMIIAAVIATTVARTIDGYSIYSVRLPAP